jgi:hypothetical protein
MRAERGTKQMESNVNSRKNASSSAVRRFIGVTVGMFFLWLCGTIVLFGNIFINAMGMAASESPSAAAVAETNQRMADLNTLFSLWLPLCLGIEIVIALFFVWKSVRQKHV